LCPEAHLWVSDRKRPSGVLNGAAQQAGKKNDAHHRQG
jgi:hypothetical protein